MLLGAALFGDRLVQAFRISACSILLRAPPTFLGSYSTENAYGIKKNTILFGSPMILLFVPISPMLSGICRKIPSATQRQERLRESENIVSVSGDGEKGRGGFRQ